MHDSLAIYRSDENTVIVNELGILQGAARVDVAVVNGILHGYEIKSERDTLSRLERQADMYGQVFDRLSLVTEQRHLTRAVGVIPEWWEVLVSVGGPQDGLYVFREGHLNRSVSCRAIAELLWRDEALDMLATRGSSRGYHSLSRRRIWDRLCEVYTLEEIRNAVRLKLKERLRPRAVGPSA